MKMQRPQDAGSGKRLVQTLRRTVHKYNEALVLIAAAIVFATFIVNDLERDHWKDISTSANELQNIIERWQDTELVVQELLPIQDLQGTSKRPTWLPIALLREVTRYRTMLSYLEGAAPRLGNADSIKHELTQCANLVRDYDYDVTSHQFDYSPEPTVAAGIRINIGIAMHTLLDDMSDAAKTTQRNAENHYERWRWVSYGLYVFGWSLGLLTKLFGSNTEVVDS